VTVGTDQLDSVLDTPKYRPASPKFRRKPGLLA